MILKNSGISIALVMTVNEALLVRHIHHNIRRIDRLYITYDHYAVNDSKLNLARRILKDINNDIQLVPIKLIGENDKLITRLKKVKYNYKYYKYIINQNVPVSIYGNGVNPLLEYFPIKKICLISHSHSELADINKKRYCFELIRDKFRYLIVRTIVRSHGKLNKANKKYSLSPRPGYETLDAFNVNIKLNKSFKKTTIVLLDHPKIYEHVKDIHNEMSSIDMIDMYYRMITKHCYEDEEIILKYHPHSSLKLSETEQYDYFQRIRTKIGPNYRVSLLKDHVRDDECYLPLELLYNALKVRKVIGTFSDVFSYADLFKDIYFICDISYLETMKHQYRLKGLPSSVHIVFE